MPTPQPTVQITTIDRLEPWKDDGNIVLVAGGKYFRVHRSVLSVHSEVFEDMFACPHSPEAETDLIDLCPVIHLQDAATDVQIVLKALYDRNYPSSRDGKTPFTVVSAFLRLGKKYEIPAFVEEAKARLYFPPESVVASPANAANLFMSLSTQFLAVSCGDPHKFQFLNLLQEMDVKAPLPLAMYKCIISCPLEDIINGYQSKGSFYSLSPANLQSFMWMKDMLERYRLQLAKTLSASYLCRASCSGKINWIWSQEMNVMAPIGPWWHEWNREFCPSCLPILKTRREAEMKKAWDQIPMAFGFASWEEVSTNGAGDFPSHGIVEILQRTMEEVPRCTLDKSTVDQLV